MSAGATTVFYLVIGARFLLPLAILRFPLPAILGCLVLDAADQSIFQWFGYDPPGYQGYDKAMDVYYLALAYIATLRNWNSDSAFRIARFLYFYRLVGVAAFELTGWRALLLIFPNTFEYFFIAYEAIRTRWDPVRFSRRFWLWAAAGIWVFVKLPQEYWIHIAKLDFTDTVADVPWFAPALIVLAVAGLLLVRLAVWPRLRPADWSWRFAADHVPAEIDSAAERDAWVAAHGGVLDGATVEKVALVGLISVIFAQVLPDLRLSNVQIFLGTAVLVVVGSALSWTVARRGRSLESLLAALGLRAAINSCLVVVFGLLLTRHALDRSNAAFFVLLLTLITGLHDHYRPVHDDRAFRARAVSNPS